MNLPTLPDLLESIARVRVMAYGAKQGDRRAINFTSNDGTVGISTVDDGVNEKVDIDLSAPGTGGGGGSNSFLYVDHFDTGNSGTTETTFYTHTLPANQMLNDGDTLEVVAAGTYTGHATASCTIRFYFGAGGYLDTAARAVTAPSPWAMRATLMRKSSSVLLTEGMLFSTGTPVFTYQRVFQPSSINFATTNVMSVSGQASGTGAGSNLVFAQMQYIRYTASP